MRLGLQSGNLFGRGVFGNSHQDLCKINVNICTVTTAFLVAQKLVDVSIGDFDSRLNLALAKACDQQFIAQSVAEFGKGQAVGL